MVAISTPPTGTAHDLYFYRSLRVIDLTNVNDDKVEDDVCHIKVVSSEFYFHKPITVHIELYLFYRFIHFLLYIGQYGLRKT